MLVFFAILGSMYQILVFNTTVSPALTQPCAPLLSQTWLGGSLVLAGQAGHIDF
jgi:hypothetical protein